MNQNTGSLVLCFDLNFYVNALEFFSMSWKKAIDCNASHFGGKMVITVESFETNGQIKKLNET